MNVMLFASHLKTFGLWCYVVAPDGIKLFLPLELGLS